jgi:hypothetical protein
MQNTGLLISSSIFEEGSNLLVVKVRDILDGGAGS